MFTWPIRFSISIVDVESAEVVKEISLGPPAELGLADRGEMLFHDSRLSSDGWYSCHSCHPDGHSNGLLNDNFSDGTYGAPKRVLSLLGVADTGPWAWNGGAGALDDQIRKSIETTMQGPAPTDGQVRAIAAYLKTLRPAPSLARARGQVNKSAIARGRAVFERYGCSDCHQPHTYTTSGIYDVDLEDEAGNTEFNPPSLRGVSQSDRLFHDNRASDLRAVLVEFQHGLDEPLAGRELDELIIFLQSL